MSISKNAELLVDVIEAAVRCIPASMNPPSLESTADEMQVQVGACTELDDLYFKKGGHGRNGAVERVNGTQMQQPRRTSWSVSLGPTLNDTHSLFAYSQSYRPCKDWRARCMPQAVFELGCCCRDAAFDHLSPISQACYPTACQGMEPASKA